jgi:hypothetical protein
MILEDATFEAFGYYAIELSLQSAKPILGACELCGKFKVTSKNAYRTLCRSCSAILSEKHKGKNNYMFGKHYLEEYRANMSAALKGKNKGKVHLKEQNKTHSKVMSSKGNPNYGKRGKDAPNYRDGKKNAQRRARSKRKGQLGYTLLLSLVEGELEHHISNNCIIGIPKRVHEMLSGYSRKKHHALILEWLKATDKTKYEIALYVLLK